MTNIYNERKDKGYEVQFYDRQGNNSMVVGCETIEDVAKVLIETCNGNVRGNFPTIWWDGRLIKE